MFRVNIYFCPKDPKPMAVYKFKITFEDYDDIFRIIEIKSTQTFLDLHKAILDAIGFDQKQLASFYMSTDSWKKGQEITLEDMTDEDDEPENKIPVMAKSKLCDYINDPHQKIIYVYDFLEIWTLFIELTGIDMKEKTGQKYPFCSKSSGLAPKQYDKVQRFGLVDDNEFKSFYTIGGSKKRELIVKEGFWYDSALNKKNAIKKFAIRLSKELSDE